MVDSAVFIAALLITHFTEVTSVGPTDGELREDLTFELREDGSFELRDAP